MLHKASELRGYHLVATDGEIGHVDDFLLDERGVAVQYLVVHPSTGIGGRLVLIAAAAIARIDSPAKKIYVTLERDAIKNAPSVETAPIDPAETVPALWI